MKPSQEPKYIIEGQVKNRQSGHAIPDDEPVFLLRARDINAIATLEAYAKLAEANGCNAEHKTAVQIRINQFKDFAHFFAKRMKKPDTQLTPDWE